MTLIFCVLCFVPEDSNYTYLLDKQLAHYFPSWEARFDSLIGGLRTSQGCLDYLHWYIDLETKFEVHLSKILGLRYRNKYLGNYQNHISNHYFEPFFQLRENLRLLLSVAPHYYKGDDEIGTGFFLGRNYLNFLEMFIIIEDFDHNFSLRKMPPGPEKILYKQHPVKLRSIFNTYWETGHLNIKCELTNRYRLQSTEPWDVYPSAYTEKGLHRCFYTRIWQDINRLRIGGIVDIKQSELLRIDTLSYEEHILEIIAEPMITYRLTEKWIPTLYLSYNYKTEDDSLFYLDAFHDSIVHYKRDVYAYFIDVAFHPGGNFVWHLGTQRQFYYSNKACEFKERRFTLGLEYRHKNIWFYIVEALEGDFPMPNWFHNHTYVQLMLKF